MENEITLEDIARRLDDLEERGWPRVPYCVVSAAKFIAGAFVGGAVAVAGGAFMARVLNPGRS